MILIAKLRVISYFTFTAITFLVCLIPLELCGWYILQQAIKNDWIVIILSPVLIAAVYLISIILFMILHSQIICRIFLPRLKPGVYPHSDIQQGVLYGLALSKDGLAISLMSALEWVPFLTQKVLKPNLLKLYGLKAGKGVYIANKGFLDSSLTEIGDHSFIGHKAHIVNHVSEQGKLIVAPVKIGKNVTVGGVSVVCPGVEIGDGAVVGACSFVPKFKKLPPNTVWFGAPIKQYIPKEETKHQADVEDSTNDTKKKGFKE